MDVEAARQEALIIAGKVAGGNIEPSRRNATKFVRGALTLLVTLSHAREIYLNS
jgi:hypothetical protein